MVQGQQFNARATPRRHFTINLQHFSISAVIFSGLKVMPTQLADIATNEASRFDICETFTRNPTSELVVHPQSFLSETSKIVHAVDR